jgi:CDP-paratose 2-epimerase
VGSGIARELARALPDAQIFGIDNLSRPGSQTNIEPLRAAGINVQVGDIRFPADLAKLPQPDWIIDAAANPSVLAGVDGKMKSRDVTDHNLLSTINLLEMCKTNGATFTLLSTSRVYSIKPLASMETQVEDGAFVAADGSLGVAEGFSTAPPISLYGATKLASEVMALEYGETFDFPVWINRCGVLAGAGQFGKPDQGIFSFWINSYLQRRALKYIGFGGHGHQVRDALHPRDLIKVLISQRGKGRNWDETRICNFAGGTKGSMSLRQLSGWCAQRFGFEHSVAADPEPRRFDLPWVVLDSSLAAKLWDWQPQTTLTEILEEIAIHAEQTPDWLDISAG